MARTADGSAKTGPLAGVTGNTNLDEMLQSNYDWLDFDEIEDIVANMGLEVTHLEELPDFDDIPVMDRVRWPYSGWE